MEDRQDKAEALLPWFSESRHALLSICAAVILTLSAIGALAVPGVLLRIPFAVVFVLTLRWVGKRERVAHWVFLRLPVIAVTGLACAAILWLL